jgi:hypothetical protein
MIFKECKGNVNVTNYFKYAKKDASPQESCLKCVTKTAVSSTQVYVCHSERNAKRFSQSTIYLIKTSNMSHWYLNLWLPKYIFQHSLLNLRPYATEMREPVWLRGINLQVSVATSPLIQKRLPPPPPPSFHCGRGKNCCITFWVTVVSKGLIPYVIPLSQKLHKLKRKYLWYHQYKYLTFDT